MYGKMLVLTFEDNEDDMMSHILSLINTREEIIQMSGLNNHLLNFKGLKIDEVQRVIIRENQLDGARYLWQDEEKSPDSGNC